MNNTFGEGLQLAQVQTGAANAFSTLVSGTGTTGSRIEVATIFIANVSGSSVTFRLCHDLDGSSFSAGTALYWNSGLSANSSLLIQAQHPSGGLAIGKNGNLAISCNVANGITCTVYGVSAIVKARTIGEG